MASNIDEKTLKKDGVCAASLPTTMGIVAGFLVQNTLKYLLNFGQVTNYLGYSALTDFFPTMNLKPNPQCEDSMCKLRQKEFQEKPKPEKITPVEEAEGPLHAENQWGICVVDESCPEKSDTKVAEGISLAYTMSEQQADVLNEEISTTEDVSLEELMSKMKSI